MVCHVINRTPAHPFVFGMQVMTESLRQAAGPALREILARITRGPAQGIMLVTLRGFLAHSGAATN